MSKQTSTDGLPCAPDSERAILASILLGAIEIGHVQRLLAVSDFALESHRRIFSRMADLDARGERIDVITLGEALGRKELAAVGGVTYLTSLTDGMPQLPDADSYIGIVKKASAQRHIVYEARVIATRAMMREDPSTILAAGTAAFAKMRAATNGHGAEAAPSVPMWPDPIRPEGFHGVAGELVRMLEPHTESDQAALLLQSLVAWGSLAGRGPYYLAEADHHHSNEFAVIVGTTAKGRKGTSWSRIRGVLGLVDKRWVDERLIAGLGSGEALIDAAGEEDRRALIIESEFARLLAVVSREGSTISANLRTAWDIGTLEIRVRERRNKVKIDGAHVSLIGHVTREELLRRLDSTESANGFGNRILWGCARRSKILPHGGGAPDLGPVGRDLQAATDFARRMGNTRVKFDADAAHLWEQIYPDLSEGKPGLLGSMTSRAEAHVVRLSLIFALLDCSEEIRVEHLSAGLAVWDYAAASAKFIWGGALGDPTADEALRALRTAGDGGLTRWDLTNHFNRNKAAAEIDRAIAVLGERGLIRSETEETGGRPSTRYWAI